MKTPLLAVVSAVLLSASMVSAKDDVPRGFAPLTELKEIQAEAVAKKKLVVLVVKGMDDECPRCAAALENGLKAVGSGVEKVFARAETIKPEDVGTVSPTLQARVKKLFTRGAAVTFVVMNPEMTTIIAEADRGDLESNEDKTEAFKKSVQAAKKTLK
ncbi:MAG: hypothetical protein H8M99_14125 [Gloeobacteraceae cyanobacterium ES-bin-144]|nr:hypothetical protein [Verrucomicrobiales bacterium]